MTKRKSSEATMTMVDQVTDNESTEGQQSTERPKYRVFAHDNAKGIRYVEDYSRNAVVLKFDNKPDEEMLQKLRVSPFKWNTEAQAWLATANFANRDTGQKLFRELAGIELQDGRTPF